MLCSKKNLRVRIMCMITEKENYVLTKGLISYQTYKFRYALKQKKKKETATSIGYCLYFLVAEEWT